MAQIAPYQFSVTYNSGVAINTATLAASNITVTAPNTSTPGVTLLSTGLTDDTSVTATYQVAAPTQAGAYQISLNTNQVSDVNGNFVAAGSLGSFSVTADTTRPTAMLTSAPSIQASSSSPYQFTVTYSDDGLINAATVGNNNLLVQLPGGTTEGATLVSTGLTSASSEVVTYQIPGPTANGAYTVKTGAVPLSDVSGNQEAAATLGTFQVTLPNTVQGTVKNATLAGVAGATVFADLNGDKIFEAGEPSATTDSSGAYSLTGLTDGTFSIAETAPGQQTLLPASGVQSVSVAAGQTVAGINFINTSASSGSATVNLTGVFTNRFKAVRAGTAASAAIRIFNRGTGTATGFVNVALLLTTDGTVATEVTTLKTARVKLKLKTNKFVGVPLAFRYPVGTTPGTYKVVAIVDTGDAIAETNKLDNIFSSTPITITVKAHG